jgi:Protein of unknown function (DUF2569)
MIVQGNVMSNPPESKPAGPEGLGGWLILPIIGFIGTIALSGFNLWQSFQALDGLVAIFTATSAPLADLKIPMAASLIGGLLVIASAAYCLHLLFSRDHRIVTFATAHYVILALVGFVELWGGTVVEAALPNEPKDPSLLKDAIRGLFVACIWIPYFHFSKRVKNTFGPPVEAASADIRGPAPH